MLETVGIAVQAEALRMVEYAVEHRLGQGAHMSNSPASDVSQITEEQKISYVDLEGRTSDEGYRLLYPDEYSAR